MSEWSKLLPLANCSLSLTVAGFECGARACENVASNMNLCSGIHRVLCFRSPLTTG